MTVKRWKSTKRNILIVHELCFSYFSCDIPMTHWTNPTVDFDLMHETRYHSRNIFNKMAVRWTLSHQASLVPEIGWKCKETYMVVLNIACERWERQMYI